MLQLMDEHRRAQMHECGFTIFERLFSPDEMAWLEAAIEAYEARLNRQANSEREVVFTQKIAERDAAIRGFAQRDEFVAISTGLLGPNTDLYFNQKVYKNPDGKTPFSWHQDDAYGPVEPSPYLTVWIAINDATEANGCISVLPGSHKLGLAAHVESAFGLSCRSHDDPDQGVVVPLTTGSVACFWSLTMHKSGPNRTQHVRKAMIFQYAPRGLKHKASGLQIKSRIPIARNGVAARD